MNVQFKTGDNFRALYADSCAALGLETGATVTANVELSTGTSIRVFAERDRALRLCQIAKGSTVCARVIAAFGTYNQAVFTEDDMVVVPETESGLNQRHTQREYGKQKSVKGKSLILCCSSRSVNRPCALKVDDEGPGYTRALAAFMKGHVRP
jgi:hypothetical protein